jgi:hypothetical protein
METTLLMILIICMIIHIILHIDNRFFDKSHSKQTTALEEMVKNAQEDFITSKRKYENIISRKNEEIQNLYKKYTVAVNELTEVKNKLNNNTIKEL